MVKSSLTGTRPKIKTSSVYFLAILIICEIFFLNFIGSILILLETPESFIPIAINIKNLSQRCLCFILALISPSNLSNKLSLVSPGTQRLNKQL